MKKNAAIFFLGFCFLLFISCKEKEEEKPKPTPPPPNLPQMHPDLFFITSLEEALKETSGLLYYDNKIFTHNDSGWPNEIYVVDTVSGEISVTILLPGADSIDYEDMAESDDYIFVADVGNNFGNRDDLCIYRIEKSELVFFADVINVPTQKISFEYEGQYMKSNSKTHNFDCEAMIFHDDSLYLFTKNRIDLKTNMYVIPNTIGHHTARFVASFNANGLITGADISSDGSKLILIGYNKSADVFLWIFTNFHGSDFFAGDYQYVNLGPFNHVGQAEAVCFYEPNKIFISSERISGKDAKLYRMQLPD